MAVTLYSAREQLETQHASTSVRLLEHEAQAAQVEHEQNISARVIVVVISFNGNHIFESKYFICIWHTLYSTEWRV